MDYHIVELTPTKCEQIAVYESYDQAFQNACHFAEVYDQGCIEILSTDELITFQQMHKQLPT